MNIIIKLLDNTKILFEVNENNTIFFIKQEIENKIYINKNTQRLIFNGYPLSDTMTLEQLKIKDNSIIHLVLQLN
jgi:hypothetical protein